MKQSLFAAALAVVVGVSGVAVAQQDVTTQRRTGLRQMSQQMEAIGGIVQTRGDQAQIAGRVDTMIAFYQTLPTLFPTPTLTPPVAQGTGDGQTRALAAIEANRADFAQKAQGMIAALNTMKAAAATGGVTADTLRATGGACAACHQSYRAR